MEVAEDLDGRADTELEEEAGWRRLLDGGEEKKHRVQGAPGVCRCRWTGTGFGVKNRRAEEQEEVGEPCPETFEDDAINRGQHQEVFQKKNLNFLDSHVLENLRLSQQ